MGARHQTRGKRRSGWDRVGGAPGPLLQHSQQVAAEHLTLAEMPNKAARCSGRAGAGVWARYTQREQKRRIHVHHRHKEHMYCQTNSNSCRTPSKEPKAGLAAPCCPHPLSPALITAHGCSRDSLSPSEWAPVRRGADFVAWKLTWIPPLLSCRHLSSLQTLSQHWTAANTWGWP